MFRFSRAPAKPEPPKSEELSISGRSVEITRRPYKRSLGLTLKMNGVIRVSAPKGIPLSRIRDFVLSQESWIEQNLRKYETVRQAYPQKAIREGELFPFFGEELPLVFEPCSGTTRPCFKIRDAKLICQVRKEMWHIFEPNAAHPELLPALAAFYKKTARTVLLKSVELYSEKMNLKPSGLSFRAQKTRWGSCSSKGRISLNWKMVIAPREVIDYVVVHELAHLRYYNHSASFWSLVATQSPDYRVQRNWLKENQFRADFLASESELHPSNDLS
jgi:predicted metal-dependent hydrolase